MNACLRSRPWFCQMFSIIRMIWSVSISWRRSEICKGTQVLWTFNSLLFNTLKVLHDSLLCFIIYESAIKMKMQPVIKTFTTLGQNFRAIFYIQMLKIFGWEGPELQQVLGNRERRTGLGSLSLCSLPIEKCKQFEQEKQCTYSSHGNSLCFPSVRHSKVRLLPINPWVCGVQTPNYKSQCVRILWGRGIAAQTLQFVLSL